MQIIVDSAALEAVAQEIEYTCNMLALTDDDSAQDDLDYYLPQLRQTGEALHGILREAKPAEEKEV